MMESLNDAQRAVMNEIVNYGLTNGFQSDVIGIAVQIAYIESRLGENTTNSQSSARGLFQYLEGTWSTYHSSLGSRDVQANQIAAMYNDLAKYESWWANPATSSNIPKDKITLGEYMYIKHHDGAAYSNFLSAPGLSIFKSTPFDFNVIDFSGGSGSGGGGGGYSYFPPMPDPGLGGGGGWWEIGDPYVRGNSASTSQLLAQNGVTPKIDGATWAPKVVSEDFAQILSTMDGSLVQYFLQDDAGLRQEVNGLVESMASFGPTAVETVRSSASIRDFDNQISVAPV
jgi:hypothetical protein